MNDDDPLPPSLPPALPTRRRGLGCFAKGCLLTITVLMFIGVGIGVFGWYLLKSSQAYFTEEPVPTRTLDATDEQYQAVLAKLQPFGQAMNEGHAATLELTANDLNTLIARLPQLAPLRGRAFLDIVNGQLVADLSFPVTDSASPAQRYVNGRATLDASFASGRFTFALRHTAPLRGVANDGLLPSMLRNPAVLQTYSEMLNRNANGFVHDLAQKDPLVSDLLTKLRTLVIQGDKIVATTLERPDLSPVATPAKMD